MTDPDTNTGLTAYARRAAMSLERILADIRSGRCKLPAGWTRERGVAHVTARASAGGAPLPAAPAPAPRTQGPAVPPEIQRIRDEALARLKAGGVK